MSIKYKLLVSYILLLVFSISILGILTASKAQDAIFNETIKNSERTADFVYNMFKVRNDLNTNQVWWDLKVAKSLLNKLGKKKLDDTDQVLINNQHVSSLYAGDTNLTLDTEFVDHLKELEESKWESISIFLLKDEQLIRVTTTLMVNNERAVGTVIDSDSIIYQNIVNKKKYCGRFYEEGLGLWRITGYEPIWDEYGQVIGAIAIGYSPLNNYLKITLRDIKVGQNGYVYILDSEGYVHAHPSLQGENILHYDFTKEIITNKEGTIRYNFNGVNKLGVYKYFEPWDLYIVSSANYDELIASSTAILLRTFIIALLVMGAGIILALLLANSIVKPINKLRAYMESASKGDVAVYSDINSKDEIGVLSNSYNKMIRENKRLMEELIETDKLKTDFFSNISHELKTPLNLILSAVQLILHYKEKDTEAAQNMNIDKYIYIIKQNTYRLIKLVNNLIDITRIDSGFFKINLRNGNIIEVIEEITLSTVDYVQSKKREIVFDTDIEEKIMAFDATMIERVILNLISNAVKFTEAGDSISVAIYDQGENLLIIVKDTGLGIPKEKQEIIFEKFKQVDTSLSRIHEGSGIGLSLVKALIEMHKGKISVHSEDGKGTEFIIQLPIRQISEEENRRQMNHNANNNKVETMQIEFSDIYH